MGYGMGAIVAFLLHGALIYLGAHFAQLEYVDFWRATVVALISYVVMILVGLLLLPLVLVPGLNVLFGGIVLLVGTACAAKIVLSCDWKAAWTIGVVTAVANTLINYMFSGCA